MEVDDAMGSIDAPTSELAVAKLDWISEAILAAGVYMYAGTNEGRTDSRAERALVQVGGWAVYFHMLGALTDELSSKVLQKVEDCLQKLETKYPPDADGGSKYLKDREELYNIGMQQWEEIQQRIKTPPLRPRSVATFEGSLEARRETRTQPRRLGN